MATFIWPTDTKRVTSHFRKDRKNHHGLDIADPGHHEIYAVADGIVTKSYTSSTYGECVMIKHNINGQVYESVYAHMRSGSRSVKVGDKVKQGQSIGVMGNTGDSRGQHLHFELHKGRWNINKTNAVDPLDYLEKDLTPKVSNTGTYKVVTEIAGYVTAADAKKRVSKATTVKPGTYYVFNKANGMINVSKKKGVPGSWINPGDNKKASKPKKSITQMATEVILGKHGNGHENRRKSLGIDKATYEKVRAEVNKRM